MYYRIKTNRFILHANVKYAITIFINTSVTFYATIKLPQTSKNFSGFDNAGLKF